MSEEPSERIEVTHNSGVPPLPQEYQEVEAPLSTDQNEATPSSSVALLSSDRQEPEGSLSSEHNEHINSSGVVSLCSEHQEPDEQPAARRDPENAPAEAFQNATSFRGSSALERIMQDILDELRKLNHTQTASQAQEKLASTKEKSPVPYTAVAGFYSTWGARYPFWARSKVSNMNEYDPELAKRFFLLLFGDSCFDIHISLPYLRLSCFWPKFQDNMNITTVHQHNDTTVQEKYQWIDGHLPRNLGSLEAHSRFHQPAEFFTDRNAPTTLDLDKDGDEHMCLGKIWWLADIPWKRRLVSNILAGVPFSKAVNADIIALLVHLFSFYRDRNSWKLNRRPAPLKLLEEDMFQKIALDDLRSFLISFANPSHPSARRSLCKLAQRPNVYGPDYNRLHLQYHLRCFVPVKERGGKATVFNAHSSAQDDVLCLQRQTAKINYLKKESHGEDLEEQVLSLSLVMLPECGTFLLVVLGGYVPPIFDEIYDSKSLPQNQSWGRIGINPWASGKLAGPAHFLALLFLLIEQWAEGWKSTLNAIDEIVSFKMPDTMDQARLDRFMFDSPDSMHLSKQYFSILQVLRIADQWIDETVAEWENTKHILVQEVKRTKQIFQGHHNPLQPFDDQVDKVTQLLRFEAKLLKERISRKTEDVKSLRDGLFNATSLREAMKGMALNRAIYVFTAVTIIYTPLGFMTGLWALPILNTNPEGDNVRPSTHAFIATFVSIPILTYLACLYMAWYYTSSGQTWQSFVRFSHKIWAALKELSTRETSSQV